MSDPAGPLLILGVGNPLLGDDGVGVHVVDEIRRRAAAGTAVLPPRTELLDGGTRGIALLPDVAGARAVVLVDAAGLDAEPGAIAVIPGARIGTGRTAKGAVVSASTGGLGELVDIARFLGILPEAVSLVGIQPAGIAVGLELSGPVAAVLDDAVRATLREARDLDARAAAVGTASPDVREKVGALA